MCGKPHPIAPRFRKSGSCVQTGEDPAKNGPAGRSNDQTGVSNVWKRKPSDPLHSLRAESYQ